MVLETDHIVETSTKTTIRGRRNYNNRGGNRNYRSNYRDNSRSRDRSSYRDDNRYTNRSNYRREDGNQRYENRNQNCAVDLGIEIGGIEAAPEKALTPEEVAKTDTKLEGRVQIIPETGTGPSLDLDPLLV